MCKKIYIFGWLYIKQGTMEEKYIEMGKEKYETFQMLVDEIKAKVDKATIKIDEYNDIIVENDDIQITISVDGYKHWTIEVVNQDGEELLIGGSAIYYSKNNDEKLEINYEFDSPRSEDPVVTTDIEALVEFIQETLNGRNLLEYAVSHLPLDP